MHSHPSALLLCKNNGAFKEMVYELITYVCLGRKIQICIRQGVCEPVTCWLHAWLFIPRLSMHVISKADVLLCPLFDSVILSCVSVRQDLQWATLNPPRIAVFHHCKPSGVEDGDRCKINECSPFPAAIILYSHKVLTPGETRESKED